MKKVKVLTILLTLALTLTACGGKEKVEQPMDIEEAISELESVAAIIESVEGVEDVNVTSEIKLEYDNSSLEGILQGISDDYTATMQCLNDEIEKVYAATESYEAYVENKQQLSDWYELALTESEALFTRTEEKSIEYFKLIVSSIDHSDDDAIDDAMDEYYDLVYDELMDDYYDEIYDEAMDDIYDYYYDGIVEDGYDLVPYEQWSDELSACYKAWSEASSPIYKAWSDASSTYYRMWSAVSSGFYKENYDIDAIIEECKSQQAAEALEQEETAEDISETLETEEETVEDTSNSGMDPAFIEAMDSYEAFFDEYVDFMNAYAEASPTDMLSMLAEYTTYMAQYAETMQKLEEIDEEELTTEEALYYTEVMARISQKLLEVGQ